MLSRLEHARNRWGGRVELIDKWLDKRQLLLVDYIKLVKEEDTSPFQSLPDVNELKSFCGKLVDYLSLGHFEVYESILAQYKKEGVDANTMLVERLPQIEATTQPCLDFGERYMKLTEDVATLEDDISELGELLARRFDLEDTLIEELHKATQ